MTLTNLTNLIGLKSTDEKIVNWFETHNLGKVPKTINANQETKGATDKINLLSYIFKFDIINDAFYPPLNPKKDNYNFECFLSNITVFSKTKNKDFKDPKPISFWEGFINPESTFDECCVFFDNKYREQLYDGKTIHFSFKKEIANNVALVIYFSGDKTNITSIELKIIEEDELISHYYFDKRDAKPTYTLLIKWLFDYKYLELSNDVYKQTLPFDHEVLLQFTQQHLKSRIWASQIKDIPHLHRFLNFDTSNIDDLYIKAAGLWDKHQAINNNKDDYDSSEKALAFKNAIVLNEKQAQIFLNSLTEKYELFKEKDSTRTINFKLHF